MIVLVCGSRSWDNQYHRIRARLAEIPLGWTIVHGGASGVDTLATDACDELGLVATAYLPKRTLPSPARYHERNDRMLDRAGLVIAFWDGESRGTKSVIQKALKRRINTEVHF